MSSSSNKKLLKDVSHDHKLELIRVDKKADIRRCIACTQGIIDDSYYKCTQVECEYFLHKFCGELASKMKHGMHPKHSLTLTTDGRERVCDACLEKTKDYVYSCGECNFELDLICATTTERQLEHPGHTHPLTLLQREMQTYCNCCGEIQKGIFYQCQKCVIFWIHEDCASFGTQADSPHHPHPLQFVYTPSIHRKYNYTKLVTCDICHKYFDNPASWHLECVPCNFTSHVHCALIKKKSEDVEEIDSEIPRLPWEGGEEEFGVIGLLNRKLVTNDEEVRITHFSHPEHELILHNEVPSAEDPNHGHQIPLSTKCNGCTQKISSPFYNCSDCDFFLHKCCAFLETSIQEPLEPLHNLVQSRKPWRVEEVFLCNWCFQISNGFSFICEDKDCQSEVDVECAFLPATIVHKSHPFHLLSLKRGDWTKAAICCQLYKSHMRYQCNRCEVNIDTECAMYPGKASHRYDHEKQFKLWYDRGAVEANYFYCERCEKPMDPKAWYYHSDTSTIGDQLIHPECILQQELPSFPKFKSSGNLIDIPCFSKFKSTKNFLQINIHPHRLHISPLSMDLSRIDEVYKACGYCEKELKVFEYGDEMVDDLVLSYACWEDGCDFILHYSCAMELQRLYCTGDEEYPDESH